MRIWEISRCEMSFTVHTRTSDRKVTAMPKTELSVGSRKNKIIFKKPNVRIALTKGKTNTVQMPANGLIV